MNKDVKIGILIGAALVAGATLIISVWPGSSVEDRLVQTYRQMPRDQDGYETLDPGRGEPSSSRTTQHQSTTQRQINVLEALESSDIADSSQASSANTATADAQEGKPVRIHEVQQGQTLSHIAQQYYGSPTQWRKILDANKKTLSDPDKVKPGMRLVIPD
ncbi:MAG: LysM peptidoglycan-binding domain-containing protein [Sedimentisphaerales bacterium]|nr:LysM peptidoglycan-binding domain-containing protein [Sedimentisphaerales bacterium]